VLLHILQPLTISNCLRIRAIVPDDTSGSSCRGTGEEAIILARLDFGELDAVPKRIGDKEARPAGDRGHHLDGHTCGSKSSAQRLEVIDLDTEVPRRVTIIRVFLAHKMQFVWADLIPDQIQVTQGLRHCDLGQSKHLAVKLPCFLVAAMWACNADMLDPPDVPFLHRDPLIAAQSHSRFRIFK
jgi:hypothetical protein